MRILKNAGILTLALAILLVDCAHGLWRISTGRPWWRDGVNPWSADRDEYVYWPAPTPLPKGVKTVIGPRESSNRAPPAVPPLMVRTRSAAPRPHRSPGEVL